jgi:hypothetical protein
MQNCNKHQQVSGEALMILGKIITTTQIPAISGNNANDQVISASLTMTNFGIPLTGSMSAIGFIIAFMEG